MHAQPEAPRGTPRGASSSDTLIALRCATRRRPTPSASAASAADRRTPVAGIIQISRVDHIGIRVKDLARALGFYRVVVRKYSISAALPVQMPAQSAMA